MATITGWYSVDDENDEVEFWCCSGYAKHHGRAGVIMQRGRYRAGSLEVDPLSPKPVWIEFDLTHRYKRVNDDGGPYFGEAMQEVSLMSAIDMKIINDLDSMRTFGRLDEPDEKTEDFGSW